MQSSENIFSVQRTVDRPLVVLASTHDSMRHIVVAMETVVDYKFLRRRSILSSLGGGGTPKTGLLFG